MKSTLKFFLYFLIREYKFPILCLHYHENSRKYRSNSGAILQLATSKKSCHFTPLLNINIYRVPLKLTVSIYLSIDLPCYGKKLKEVNILNMYFQWSQYSVFIIKKNWLEMQRFFDFCQNISVKFQKLLI